MAVAPEPYLSACMAVMFQASLGCRSWGWSGEVSAEHLADLMDAIHNIPALVRQWELCDVRKSGSSRASSLTFIDQRTCRFQERLIRPWPMPFVRLYSGIVSGNR
jgi:hypothetical protein